MSYTPGPNGELPPNGRNRHFGMNPRQRLTTPMDNAAPVQQHTPDQAWWRGSLGTGRWNTDPQAPAAPVNMIRQDANGTTDLVKLEPIHHADGPDEYIDLGGRGGVDVAIGRL